MSTTQVIDPADVICGLKAAVTALECYHNINLLKQQQQQVQQRKLQRSPMYMMVPIEEDAEKDVKSHKRKGQEKRTASAVHSRLKPRRPADCMLSEDERMKEKDGYCSNGLNISDLKFPEMRSGILFTKCYCVHRNGLQDSCPLSQCQGQPECLVKPWPVCPPAKFLRSRHPELYSTPPNPESITY